MANDTDKNLARRIEDQRPAAAIDWSKPGAPAVPLPGTAGTAQGGNTSIEGLGEYVWTEAGDKVLVADLKAAILPPLTAPASLADELPAILFDGHAVYSEITLHLGRGHCFTPEAVSATLDAVVRLMRAERKSAAPAPQQSESFNEREFTGFVNNYFDLCNASPIDYKACQAAWKALTGYIDGKITAAKAAPAAPVSGTSIAAMLIPTIGEVMGAPAAPVQTPMLVPKWAGEFSTFNDWVNRAQRVLSVPSHKPNAICVDAKGRRCFIGADMARARDEGAFPVRYFWECEPVAPVQAEQAQAEPSDPILATWPERIWLQWNPDEREEYPGASEGLTWCADNIHKTDVGYVRADLAAPALPAQAEQVAAVRAAYEKAAMVCQNMYEDGEGGAACSVAADRIRFLATKEAAAVEAPSQPQIDAVMAAIQHACGALPVGYEVILEMENGAGCVVWIDDENERHVIDGEGYITQDIYEAVEKAQAHAAQQSPQSDMGGDRV